MRVLLATTATPDARKTVACARSLARAGAWLAVGGDELWGQAFYSRFVARRVRYPHPRNGVDSFIEALLELIERWSIDAVLPMNDYTTLAMSRRRERLRGQVATLLPPTDAVELAAETPK